MGFRERFLMAKKRPKVVVVGAGAFGGWTALYLLGRGGARNPIDARGAGEPRAASGSGTPIIRRTYGPGSHFTKMPARALRLS